MNRIRSRIRKWITWARYEIALWKLYFW